MVAQPVTMSLPSHDVSRCVKGWHSYGECAVSHGPCGGRVSRKR